MKCPKCEQEMEFELIKGFSGYWYCDECDKDYPGEMIPCDSDGERITDCEERITS